MIEHAYIHIPFCLRKCRYCSFISGENIEHKEIYLKSLIWEINNRYSGEKIRTLYIGGGTPSLLEENDLENIVNLFNFENKTEVTLEVNPETVVSQKFRGFKTVGINRISLGVQTFNDNILRFIGRRHNSRDIYRALEIIKKAGFENISIDLMYGLPFQTKELFETDLNQVKNLDIQHISTYGLKIETGSFFYEHRPKNLPDDEIQSEMYNILCDKLNNFNHYEISNFALNDFYSRHNFAYWQNKEYYGFGLNASGYEKNRRYKNSSNLSEYLKNPLNKEEEIFLTKKETLENEIILALRLKSGVNINTINTKYNFDFMKKYGNIIKKYEKLNLLECKDKTIKLTRNGILLSNEIMSEFIDI